MVWKSYENNDGKILMHLSIITIWVQGFVIASQLIGLT